MLFLLAALISSAHAMCACDATSGKCLYAGNGEYTCDVPEDSTCSDVWKTSTMGIYQYESKIPCAGIKRGEGRTCFVNACSGGDFCMGSAIKRIIYKLADGNCYKPWESCDNCDVLSKPQDRRALLPVSCPKMECALSGQRAFSFDCRGRCASGYSCHAASGQCRWHMNTRSSSCAGTCGGGYCCNHQSNRCDTCADLEQNVGWDGSDSDEHFGRVASAGFNTGYSRSSDSWDSDETATGDVMQFSCKMICHSGAYDHTEASLKQCEATWCTGDAEQAVAGYDDPELKAECVASGGKWMNYMSYVFFCQKAETAIGQRDILQYSCDKFCRDDRLQLSAAAKQQCEATWCTSGYSQAFTGASQSTFSVVNVFAVFGLGVVLYGSFRHYVK